MKSASITEVGPKLGDHLARGDQGPLVVTSEGRPVALVLSIRDEEEIERLALAYSPQFQAILDVSRDQIRRGEGIASEDFWADIESDESPKPQAP